MDFFKVVGQRKSIRAFQPREIAADRLERLLECVNRAPSAGNLQAYEVYLVRASRLRAALVSAAAGQEFVGQAPVVLVFCTHAKRAEERYKERGTGLYALQDATIACTYAMLAATALGLATVWVGKFDEAAVAAVVGAPLGQRPVAILPVGYAAEAPHAPKRRELSDLVHEVK